MTKTYYYVMNIPLLSLVVFSVLLFGLIEITNAYGESFSYSEQLRYATLSEKMTGHVIASYENISDGNDRLAKLHLTHPFEEEFDNMRSFYDHYVDFESKAEYILYVVSNMHDDDKDVFDQQAKEILFLAKQGKKVIIDDDLLHDKYFNLLTASSLLESSKIELIESENSSGEYSLLEYQDAFGFAVRAHMIIDAIQYLPPEFKSNTEAKFTKLFYAFGNSKDIKQIMQIEEEIILEIYNYVIEHKPTFKDPVNEQVEKERIVLIKTKEFVNEELSVFVGENFPENTNVIISYTSSNSDELSTLDVNTTSEGEFFVPIEFISDNATYFVQVTCAELTTNHMLVVDLESKT